MKKIRTEDASPSRRQGERGAALITALLLSMLLLVAGGALILTSSTGSVTAAESTAEMQAYYAAEAGLQSALAVLRGNVAPRAGLNPPAGTLMRNNFRAANQLSISNSADDAASDPDNNAATDDGYARLSGWLPYNGTGVGAVVPVGANSFQLTISDPDDLTRAQLDGNAAYVPTRLVITSTGFGPKGARKQMRMMMRHGAFDFDAPSTVTLTGNVTGFDIGASRVKGYTGVDQGGSGETIPMFGFTDDASKTTITANNFNPGCTSTQCDKASDSTSDPETETLTAANPKTPAWLLSAADARAFLNDLQFKAQGDGRYFATKDGVPITGGVGTSADPKFTFVDGDLSLSGSGAGLLVVTGDLTLNGNFDFDGLILVLGGWKDAGGTLHGGNLERDGGGNGTVAGAIVVSHFDRTTNGGFLSTTFDTDGGGKSDIEYDSQKAGNALNTLASRVLGVSEF